MFYEEFDEFLPAQQREINKGVAALRPKHLLTEIDSINALIYENVNNGVYKAGFASSQASYDENVTKIFDALDRVEDHLSKSSHVPYLFGDYITEADIRLFTTLIRFDVAYYPLFKCNLKMIRYDYPHLHGWLRRLYWNEGPETAGGVFKSTTLFAEVSADSQLSTWYLPLLDQTWVFVSWCWERHNSSRTNAVYSASIAAYSITRRIHLSAVALVYPLRVPISMLNWPAKPDEDLLLW
jgi:hypothetical protein